MYMPITLRSKPRAAAPIASILDILTMDGRRRAPRVRTLTGPPDRTPAVSTVKIAIAEFERTGSTNHSAQGLLLPYIVAYCEAKGYPYTLHAISDETNRRLGYYIKREPALVPTTTIEPSASAMSPSV